MFERRLIYSCIAAAAAIAASPSTASAMTVKFSWAGYTACSSRSPAFTLSDVPSGTVKLAFRMIDKDAPTYPHGGGTIAYSGNDEISAGAFSYKGPCPPAGQQHSYQWTVQALNGHGHEITSASAVEKFPPR
jgi:phosphatidylethanolamine-binding protein (PEBP) family uncharacterized protein